MNRNIAFVLPVLLFLAGCNPKDRTKEVKCSPVEVTVMCAVPGVGCGSISYVGTVEASGTASLKPGVPGTLASVRVKAGELVRKGQTLATIESQTARSAYAAAKSSLDQAEDGWSRIVKVYETGSVSEVKYNEIRAKLEQARATEAAARRTLEDCTVKAPFTGVVEDVFMTVGTQVDPLTVLMTVVDISRPEVHFPLPENEYRSLEPGAAAKVDIPAAGAVFDAVLRSKGSVASRLSHSYDCTLSLDGADTRGVMPGMVCKVSFEPQGGKSGFEIPASAVRTDMQGRYVWVVCSGTACRKRVTVDGFGNRGVVVSDGLVPGDLVIVEGSRKVSSGMKVRAVEEDRKR